MDQFENNLWSAPAKANKLRLFVLGQLQVCPQPTPAQPPRLVDPVDRRDWEDYDIDPDRPDSLLSGDDIDLALAALMKGLQGIYCAELETLLKDLPMP